MQLDFANFGEPATNCKLQNQVPKRDSRLKGGICSDAVSRDSPDLFHALRKALRDAVSIEKLLPESSIHNGSDIYQKLMLI